MQEPYGEESTAHPDPESCAGGSNASLRRSVDRGRCRSGIELRYQHSLGPTLSKEAEGNIGQDVKSKSCQAQAQSKTPHMQGHLLHGNRDAPVASGVDVTHERTGKAEGRTPVVNAVGESDAVAVPKITLNKAGRTAAEAGEGKTATERNTDQAATPRTQSRTSVSIGLEGVRAAARMDGKLRFTALLHHMDAGLMRECFFDLKKSAAPGIDGMTWGAYEDKVEERIADLHRRVHTGAYCALPSKRAYIPKADGQQRPLGIAALEDKIVQSAMVVVLNAIYEGDFAGFSYGSRPGRGQHDCLDALSAAIMGKQVNWVLDADIRRFFDTIDHGWMMKFLEHRIADQRILRLIQKWLTAGVMEGGVWSETKQGTPQGAVISPLLANVFLHYAFDLWAKHWRKTKANGEVYLVRYVDDFVVCFERKADGEQFLAELGERLRSFGLALHPDKTRLIEFGRFAACNRRRRGKGHPETFNFLGFTHICGKTRKGNPIIWRQTIAKRMAGKVKEVAEELMKRRHDPIPVLGAWLRSVISGYFNYFAVPGNRLSIGAFRREVAKAWLRALKRRSQRSRMNWIRFKGLILRWLPKPETKHPYPWVRFAATHSM